MSKWHQQTYRMPKNHGWKCKKGYQSFVADYGVVRFDIPSGWICEPSDTSFKFHDREPPDDTCILEMSIFRLPPGPNWRELPLSQLLGDIGTNPSHEVLSQGEIVALQRGGLEMAWREERYVDEEEKREARSRCLVARRDLIQPLITFAYWPEDAPRLLPVWDELVRTLRVGEYVSPPIQRPRN